MRAQSSWTWSSTARAACWALSSLEGDQGRVAKIDLTSGSSSILTSTLAPAVTGSGNGFGQSIGALAMDLNGYLWVYQYRADGANTGLAQIDPATGNVLRVVPVPATLSGGRLVCHMALMGKVLPYAGCVASTLTPSPTTTPSPSSTVTPSVTPSVTSSSTPSSSVTPSSTVSPSFSTSPTGTDSFTVTCSPSVTPTYSDTATHRA